MTATPEFNRWQERFSTPDFIFGKAPNEFLVRCKDLLPRAGKALAVADGEGRNSVFLAQQDLDVTATEFAPAAIDKARRLAAEKNVSVNIIETDVHSWDYPENAFDVVVDIFTQFSTPPERAIKWAGMCSTLKPGGLLIIRGYAQAIAIRHRRTKGGRATLHARDAQERVRRFRRYPHYRGRT